MEKKIEAAMHSIIGLYKDYIKVIEGSFTVDIRVQAGHRGPCCNLVWSLV